MINSILFELILFRKLSKFHIIHFIFIFSCFYQYSHDLLFDDHGYYNFVGFFIILLIIVITAFTIIKLINIFTKNRYLLMLFTILFSFLIFYFIIYDPINCNGWERGLNNTNIDNDVNKFGCQIIIPKKCPQRYLKYFQDMTKLRGINCTKQKSSKKLILKKSKSKYINENTTIFGFPLTNKDPRCFSDSVDETVITDYFFKHLFDMDKIKETNFMQPEIIADYHNNPDGELKINLIFNETLSIERKALEGKIRPYSENIIVIFVDSVSRPNSLRQLKKTLRFFEKFMSYEGGYNENFPKEKFHSFQFFKYYAFNGVTH